MKYGIFDFLDSLHSFDLQLLCVIKPTLLFFRFSFFLFISKNCMIPPRTYRYYTDQHLLLYREHTSPTSGVSFFFFRERFLVRKNRVLYPTQSISTGQRVEHTHTNQTSLNTWDERGGLPLKCSMYLQLQ